MDKIIGLKELRTHVNKYVEEVRRGRSFVVVRKSRPLFKISPLMDEGVWETVVDFTKIKKGGISASEVLKCL